MAQERQFTWGFNSKTIVRRGEKGGERKTTWASRTHPTEGPKTGHSPKEESDDERLVREKKRDTRTVRFKKKGTCRRKSSVSMSPGKRKNSTAKHMLVEGGFWGGSGKDG